MRPVTGHYRQLPGATNRPLAGLDTVYVTVTGAKITVSQVLIGLLNTPAEFTAL
jgi:hypothetical protein